MGFGDSKMVCESKLAAFSTEVSKTDNIKADKNPTIW